jgi:hypothetical protein
MGSVSESSADASSVAVCCGWTPMCPSTSLLSSTGQPVSPGTVRPPVSHRDARRPASVRLRRP